MKQISREGTISTLSGKTLKLVYLFTYLGCNISSLKAMSKFVYGRHGQLLNSLSIIWKFDLSDKIKTGFFQAVAVSVWMQHLDSKEKLEVKIMHCLLLNKYWKQLPTKQQLCNHLLPISKTIKVRSIWHAEQCWRSKNKVISDILPWTTTNRHTSFGRPVMICIISSVGTRGAV